MRYIDSDTLDQCHQALRDGTTLDDLAGRLHFDTVTLAGLLDQCHQALRDGTTLDDLAGKLHVEPELLGRLLQLPTSQPVTVDDEPDLWSVDRLNEQL